MLRMNWRTLLPLSLFLALTSAAPTVLAEPETPTGESPRAYYERLMTFPTDPAEVYWQTYPANQVPTELFTDIAVDCHPILSRSNRWSTDFLLSDEALFPTTPDYKACVQNLRNLGTMCEMYATDNKGLFPARLVDLVPHFTEEIPLCPAGISEYRYMAQRHAGTILCGNDHTADDRAGFPRWSSVDGIQTHAQKWPGNRRPVDFRHFFIGEPTFVNASRAIVPFREQIKIYGKEITIDGSCQVVRVGSSWQIDAVASAPDLSEHWREIQRNPALWLQYYPAWSQTYGAGLTIMSYYRFVAERGSGP